MGYCSVSELLAFVPTLRIDGSTESTTSYLSSMINIDAVRINAVLRYKGYLYPSFDTFQSRLLRFLNCLATAQSLLFARGNEVDPAYLVIVNQNKSFLSWLLDALVNGYLDIPFLGQDYTLPLDSTRPSFQTTSFTGTGLSTITVINQFSDIVNANFTVQILSPTTFQWRRDANPFSAPVTITGTAQNLSDGVSVILPLSGHVIGDTWTINIFLTATAFDLQAMYPVLFDGIGIDSNMLNLYLDSATVFVKGLASHMGYRLHDLNKTEALSFGNTIALLAGGLTGMAVDMVTRQGQSTDTTVNAIGKARQECSYLLQGRYSEIHRKAI